MNKPIDKHQDAEIRLLFQAQIWTLAVKSTAWVTGLTEPLSNILTLIAKLDLMQRKDLIYPYTLVYCKDIYILLEGLWSNFSI